MTDPSRHQVNLTVNGIPYRLEVPARRLLSDFLRHDIRLTGTHVGCEHGVCGACTVLVDGLPIRSCLAFAVAVDGCAVTTIEGLAADDGTLHPVQQAFRDHHGLQCGFCTPGFVLSACGYLADQLGFLEGDDDPDRLVPSAEHAPPDLPGSSLGTGDGDGVREAMAGNLCRCTGYAGILQAVRSSAEVFANSGADPRARHAPERAPDVAGSATAADDADDAADSRGVS